MSTSNLFCMSKALLVFLAGACLASAANPTINLAPNLASPQLIGIPITWTATATGGNPGDVYDYRFSIGPQGKPLQILRDFSPGNTFTWAPHDTEGNFAVRVVVRNRSTSPFTIFPPVTLVYGIQARIPLGGPAAVSSTNHPLVALFSAPACAVGNFRIVRFQLSGAAASSKTAPLACTGTTTENFLVAGMLPSSTYQMHSDVLDSTGALVRSGQTVSYTTGAIPSSVPFPSFTVVKPASTLGQAFPVVFHAFLNVGALFGKPAYVPTATDLSGNVIWYYPVPASVGRLERVGGVWVQLTVGNSSLASSQVTREIDLAGNTIRETNARVVSDQLIAMGGPAISDFHHETRRMPNGDILVLAARDMSVTDARQCQASGSITCDVIGDLILVLDPNMQLKWYWDAFTKLTPSNLVNVSRPAILGETCKANGAGCSPITAIDPSTGMTYTVANDWMHANSAQFTNDGNIVISVRNQDVAMKINYSNGTGDGRVLWTMGNGGDFRFTTLTSPCDSADGTTYIGLLNWFTHQHDAEFNPDGSFTIFDDGNTRKLYCDPNGNSRGQAYTVDEAEKTVTPILNGDLGGYSFAIGSAQVVNYGTQTTYSFDNGLINGFTPSGFSQTSEVDGAGNLLFRIQAPTLTYRTFRMADLYTPPEP